MFTSKMQEELQMEYMVTNENILKPVKEKYKGFLMLFSINKLSTPELIWNNDTRSELLNIL